MTTQFFNRALIVFLSVALSATFTLTGCGGGDDAGGGGDATPTKTDDGGSKASGGGDRTPFPAAKATASVSGKVMFKGDKPTVKKIRIQGDDFCMAQHPTAPNDETYLIGDDNTIANVFVYVKSGADKWEFKVPSTPVMLEQKGCTYMPHVFGIMAGQTVTVKSSDETKHNVHFKGKKNKAFNFSQVFNQSDDQKFSREEIMAPVECDVHSWMRSYANIVYHTLHDVTAAGGAFELPKLPPGDYEIAAVHEALGTQTQKITVADGDSKTIEFTFSK